MTVVYDIQIGERFKPAGRSKFGNPNSDVFEVGSIRIEGCVVPHAQLFNIKDPMDKKFLSVDALRDTMLYVPVENPDFEPIGEAAE
jgi:hypothetical protein